MELLANYPQGEIAKFEHAHPVPEAIAAVAPKFFKQAGSVDEQRFLIHLEKPIGSTAAATCFDEGLKDRIAECGMGLLSSNVVHQDGQMSYEAEVRAKDPRQLLGEVIANTNLYGPDVYDCVVNADHPEVVQVQFGDPAVGSHFTIAMKNISRGVTPEPRHFTSKASFSTEVAPR